MAGTAHGTRTEEAARYLADGAPAEAFARLVEADLDAPLDVDDLDLLARAAYAAGEFEAAVGAWERCYALHAAAGRQLDAAGVAATIAMYLMMDTGLMAPVRGWVARSERLLEGHGETPVHAMLAMLCTYERFLCGDLAAASEWAARAIDLGVRYDVPAAAALGRVARARLHIFDGRIDEGLRLLDEAAVATVSGELDALATGMVYCELICAMQGLAQFDRAEQWTVAMDRWRRGTAYGGINGRCRVHRAEILRLRGSCDEAEEEALHACRELRPWMRREYGWPLTELGTIRFRRGDLAGAEEAFLEAHGNGWDPQPGLALVRLARGDAETAAAMLAGALDHPLPIPSKERPPNEALRRAPLLDADVVVALAIGDTDRADAAARELADIATTFQSTALTAAAALAAGRVAVARGDGDGALASCTSAVDGWCTIGAPYETALARLVLAEAHRLRGADELAALESQLASEGLARIGAVPPPVVVTAAAVAGPVVASSGSSAVETADATFRCEGDVRTIAFAGVTTQLRELKGFRYLERMLRTPGRELHVLDLVAQEGGATEEAPDGARADVAAEELRVGGAGSDLGPLLDAQAKAAYERRLEEIDDDIAEATRLGDTGRVELARADREFLVRELARAFGLAGRHRPVGSSSERARTSVTRAIRYAMARIAEHHPPLAEHLDHTVATGTYCGYAPDPRAPIRWTT